MLLIYLLLWFPMTIIGILNGIARTSLYGPLMSELLAHQVSTVSGIILFGLYTWVVTGRWRLQSGGQAIAVGIVWLALTVAFEFVFGHYVVGHPWSRLLQDYDLLAGRIWVLVLIWIAVAPYIMYRLRS